MTNNSLKLLRFFAITEGISYLMLGITVILKYIFLIPEPNIVVGLLHGVLVVAYCIFVLLVGRQRRWSLGKIAICLFASLLPIATFIVDVKILKKEVN